MVAIILIKPQMGENIGAAARVMLNFGLTDLRIVNPRDGWPNEKAIEMSAGAKEIIANAKVFDSTQNAIADLQYIYATTARNRDLTKQVIAPAQMVKKTNMGVMFGGERSGLENDDVAFANELISIPVNPDYSSLNLGMSVGIIAYELTKHSSEINNHETATKSEIDSMCEYLDIELSAKDFFQTPEKKPRLIQNIKTMFNRAEFTSQEVRTLRGLLRALARPSLKS